MSNQQKGTFLSRFLFLGISSLFFICFSFSSYSQKGGLLETQVKTKRILFIFDGSGSMKSDWEGNKKIKTARKLLVDVIDSINRSRSGIEFGLRVFGHQYPRSANNCKDSKLEVPFAPNNVSKIKNKLSRITPQGWSPIAYSLFQSMNDFPNDPSAKNAIILITDGIENCQGDLCAAGKALQKQGITLKPFIIGLGLGKKGKEVFDCVGTYRDAETKKSFRKTLNVVVSQALNKTTTQVHLLDVYDKPSETNVEMTFYDHFSGKVRHNFVHAMDRNGVPDTLYLSPTSKYDLTVHTTPPVTKKDIELIPGKHNIIAVRAPQGSLNIYTDKSKSTIGIQTVVSKQGSRETVSLQDMNVTKKYLTGKYHIEVLTLPRITKEVQIKQSYTTEIEVPKAGKLNIRVSEPGIGSLYMVENNRYKKIYEFENMKGEESLNLLPGQYKFVYRADRVFEVEKTQEKSFHITSGGIMNIKF